MEFSPDFRKKRVDENVLLPSAVFQVALAQNNPYVKVAYIVVSYSVALPSVMGHFPSEIQGPLNPWSLKSCEFKQGSQSQRLQHSLSLLCARSGDHSPV